MYAADGQPFEMALYQGRLIGKTRPPTYQGQVAQAALVRALAIGLNNALALQSTSCSRVQGTLSRPR